MARGNIKSPWATKPRTAQNLAKNLLAKAVQAARNRPTAGDVRAQRMRNMRAQVQRGFLGAAGEAKYFDTAATGRALNTTGTVIHLDIVPQGTTVNSRDGRKFKNTSVQLRGYAQSDTATTITNGMMLLVWDRQPNKVLAGVTDILESATSFAFAKRENAQRFRILKKWRWCFGGNSTTPATGKEVYDIDDYVKLPDECIAECTASDTTGAIGNRVTGALLLLTIGDIAAGTTDAICNIGARVNFVDL